MYSVMEQQKSSPFRKGKENLTADDEMCKTCGKCCKKYRVISIIPFDFEDDGVAEGLVWLKEKDLLFIEYANATHHGGYYTPKMIQRFNCYFLNENGCTLNAGERPIVCILYGPKRFTKKGKPVKRIRCDCLPNEWLKQERIKRFGDEWDSWSKFTSWRPYRDVLEKLYKKLPDNRRLEISRSSWATTIISGSFGLKKRDKMW